jgi:hypothetical protein
MSEEVIKQYESALMQQALFGLISLAVKPDWSVDQHSRFFFRTMDKKFEGSPYQHFVEELKKQK